MQMNAKIKFKQVTTETGIKEAPTLHQIPFELSLIRDFIKGVVTACQYNMSGASGTQWSSNSRHGHRRSVI